MPAYPLTGGIAISDSTSIGWELGNADPNEFGPSANRAAVEGLRNTYANDEANADWLRQYIANRNWVVHLQITGDDDLYTFIDRDNTTVVDRLWIGDDPTNYVRAFSAANGRREADEDFTHPAGIAVGVAANSTRVYVFDDETGGTYAIRAYDHNGAAQTGDDIATVLTLPAGTSWQGIAASDSTIYLLRRAQNGQAGDIIAYTTAGARQSGSDVAASVIAFAGVTDIAIGPRGNWLLGSNGSVYGFNASWTRESTRDFTATETTRSGTAASIAEHGDEIYVLSSDGIVAVYSIPTSGAPTFERQFNTGLSTPKGIAQVYSATITWDVAVLEGPAGRRGARGPQGVIDAGSLVTAAIALDETQKQQVDNALEIEQSDWDEADTTDRAYIKNKPQLAPPRRGTERQRRLECHQRRCGDPEQARTRAVQRGAKRPGRLGRVRFQR